jgi:hypothetical protein
LKRRGEETMGPHNRHYKEERESGFPKMKIEKLSILAIFVAALAVICLSAQPAFAVMNAVDDTGSTRMRTAYWM